ncbi:MAG: hypothetical protein MUE53_06240 [Chitinophagales bacterium]|jgi:hypothetical protein|nr:hypothetical protein [Chitinophagales bacterium]
MNIVKISFLYIIIFNVQNVAAEHVNVLKVVMPETVSKLDTPKDAYDIYVDSLVEVHWDKIKDYSPKKQKQYLLDLIKNDISPQKKSEIYKSKISQEVAKEWKSKIKGSEALESKEYQEADKDDSVAGFVFGILSVIPAFYLVLSIPLGLIGIVTSRRDKFKSKKKGLATAGNILSTIGFVFGLLTTAIYLILLNR